VEQALADCPGVVEVAVVGVPDDEWGQRVCALVVGDAEPAVLDAHARGRLGPAQRPKRYRRVAALPRTDTGKIRRVELPALLTDD
jgi:long-chain acyl-CoA synthetase